MLRVLTGILFLASLYLAWDKELFTKVTLPCAEPIAYSIGNFDRRFDISLQDFLEALSDAEEIWERAFLTMGGSPNKELFAYDPEDGDLKINLVYDYRQEVTEELSELQSEVKEDEALYRSLERDYAALKNQYAELNRSYEARASAFQHNRLEYEQAVIRWNTGSRTSKNEFEALQEQERALERELAEVKELEANLNNKVKEINTLVARLNRLAKTLNLNVEEYNTVGASRGETFAGGIYSSSEEGVKIDIYEFSSREKLVRILAHELGHALGLEHLEDPEAIMYKFNEGDKEKLSQTDLNSLKLLCQIN